MPQNIFDNDIFFTEYIKLRNNPVGHNELIEFPCILSLLPREFTGLRILDLGCGAGHFCKYAVDHGAEFVLGVDISKKMLCAASKIKSDKIMYINADMESICLRPASFDVVFSSLALHYIGDYLALLQNVKLCLKTGGIFVFSVEHPVYTSTVLGWEINNAGGKLFWRLDKYSSEGLRKMHWLVDGVEKYHRKIETYLMGLLSVGFSIDAVLEPQADISVLNINPSLSYENLRPPYLLIRAST